MSKKNPRFRICHVKTIIPSEYVKEIMSNNSFNSRNTQSTLTHHIDNKSIDVIKNSDDNTSLIQKQIGSFRSFVEKSFILLFAVLFLDGLIQILS